MTAYHGGRKHCHKLIAETAKEMAAAAVGEMLEDDKIYTQAKVKWPDLTLKQLEATLIKNTWPNLIEQARATLAKLLATNIDESLKDQIANALILDNSLRGNSPKGGARFGH